MLINIFSDVLEMSDIFFFYLKSLLKQYKLNWEQCSFFQYQSVPMAYVRQQIHGSSAMLVKLQTSP